MLILVFVWGLFTLGVDAVTAEPSPCFASLALLSDGDPPTVVIEATYRRLLDSVGGRLTADGRQTTLAKGDPFSLSEEGGADLFASNRHLKEFEKMLEQKKWNSPELRQRLLSTLEKTFSEWDRASKKIVEAIHRVRPARTIPLLHFLSHQATSPDGNWLVASHVGSLPTRYLDPWQITAHNLVTGQVVTTTGPREGYGRFEFSPNGKHLWFARSSFRIAEVPFHDGTVDFAKLNLLGQKDDPGIMHMEEIRHGADPRFIFGTTSSSAQTLHRLNRGTGEQSRFDLGLPTDEKVESWAFAPGTDEIVFIVRSDITKTVRALTRNFSARGAGGLGDRSTSPKALPPTGNSPKYIPAWNGGGRLWITDGTGGYAYNETTRQFENILPQVQFRLPSGRLLTQPTTILGRPGHEEFALIFMENNGTAGIPPPRSFVQFWAASGLEALGQAELPVGATSVEYSRDGESLVVVQGHAKTVQIIPHDLLLAK